MSVLFSFTACKKELCSDKASFLAAFDTYLASKEGQTVSEKDTIFFDDAYRELVNQCYKKFKPELTLKERQDFWKRSIKHVLANRNKDLDLNISDNMEDPFHQYVMDEIKALIKESGSSFILELQSLLKDDLSQLIDLFSSEINRIGKDLLKFLEKE